MSTDTVLMQRNESIGYVDSSRGDRRLPWCRVFYDTIYIEWSSVPSSLHTLTMLEGWLGEKGERGRLAREIRRRTMCLYSRARKSVMRSRHEADAENIHHAHDAPISFCRSLLHNYILASFRRLSPKKRERERSGTLLAPPYLVQLLARLCNGANNTRGN